jgi:hypothetical protein
MSDGPRDTDRDWGRPKLPEKPTLGRIVHVVWPDGVESPAIVTRTNRDTMGVPSFATGALLPVADRWDNSPMAQMEDDWHCDLMVCGLTSVYPLYNVPCSNGERVSKHWHWPVPR